MGNNPFIELQQQIDDRYNSLEQKLDGVGQLMQKILNQKEYSVEELAEKTGRSPQTIRNKIIDGTIKARQFGRKYIISHEEFLNACTRIKTLKHKR